MPRELNLHFPRDDVSKLCVHVCSPEQVLAAVTEARGRAAPGRHRRQHERGPDPEAGGELFVQDQRQQLAADVRWARCEADRRGCNAGLPRPCRCWRLRSSTSSLPFLVIRFERVDFDALLVAQVRAPGRGEHVPRSVTLFDLTATRGAERGGE